MKTTLKNKKEMKPILTYVSKEDAKDARKQRLSTPFEILNRELRNLATEAKRALS